MSPTSETIQCVTHGGVITCDRGDMVGAQCPVEIQPEAASSSTATWATHKAR